MRDGVARQLVKGTDVLAALFRDDQHDLILQQVLARAIGEQARLLEGIHLLLGSGEEQVRIAAILDGLLQRARAAVVEHDLDVRVLSLIVLADLIHDIGQARRCRDVEFHGFLRRGLRFVAGRLAAAATHDCEQAGCQQGK